jgi:serine phosphatase RsbU (regulator of sigma subunit)
LRNSKPRLNISLFLQLTLIVIIIAGLSLIISLGIYRENIAKLLTAEVENKATIFLSGLEGSVRLLATGRGPAIRLADILDVKAEFLKQQLTFKIIRVAVLDPQGRILDHTITERIGQIHTNDDFKQAVARGRPLVVREIKTLRLEPGSPEVPVIKIYYPVFGHQNRGLVAMIMMDVDVELTMEAIRGEYGRFNRRVITGFALTTALMMIGILFFLKRRIINPVTTVAQASGHLAEGHMELLPVPKRRDEMARLIQAFNHMVVGLQQRDQMRLSLELAREVQQRLLPKIAPKIRGLDIAGKSIYCDATGGDYLDYLYNDGQSDIDRVLVAVGDVSDHGIQSALLMATARAALHQRWIGAESLVRILTDVNRQLVMDVADSGYFMTLFLAWIDTQKRLIQWANAGHDPAMVYDRNTDTFTELAGRGLALGVDGAAVYGQWQQEIIKGQILIIGTDGIWEAHGPNGEMYGKARLKAVVRNNAAATAKEIVAAIIREGEKFINQPLEDDITVMAIKIDS